jgi:alanine dehydrogenase
MQSTETLLLKRHDVAQLLTIEECIDAVEKAFKLYAIGDASAPGVMGIHAKNGGFHIKAGILNLGKDYFVAKINANFPGNSKQYGLPTIQGVIAVCDAENGKVLALMDSIEITIIRTGAATAVAAKYLAKPNAKTLAICGAGNQGRISARAIMKVRPIENVFVYDIDKTRAGQFADELSNELNISVLAVDDLKKAMLHSDICVTCTPSKTPFVFPDSIAPGTFIAAVGADSDDKRELASSLLVSGKLVTDITAQCAVMGELHHALKMGLMRQDDVHAEIGQIIAGEKQGRTSEEEIIIFDSTGTALQDIAAAAIVYEKALTRGIGIKVDFGEIGNNS